MAYKILDVSAYQPNVDWRAVKRDGVSGVWVKATEGYSWVSPTYHAQVKGARAAGLRVGAYHYARPDLHPYDPEGEARGFARVIGKPERRDLRPVLDMEVAAPKLSDAQLAAWCRRFNQEVKRLTGVLPVFYSYSYFIDANLSGLDTPIGAALWLANYGRNDGVPFPVSPPKPWRKVHAHQFTSRYRVAGISGGVDMSTAPRLRPLLAHPILGLL